MDQTATSLLVSTSCSSTDPARADRVGELAPDTIAYWRGARSISEVDVSEQDSAYVPADLLTLTQFSRRQEQVLDSLEAAFLEHGFRTPTVGYLAARAKCSRRTLYEIAPTKGELFLIVLERMMNRLDKSAREFVHSSDDPATKIEKLLGSGVTLFRPAGPEFAADLTDYQPARMLFERHTDRVRGSIVRIVREGIASGHFLGVDPDVVAEVMLIMTRHLSEPAYLARTGKTYSEAMSSLYDFLRHGFAVPEA